VNDLKVERDAKDNAPDKYEYTQKIIDLSEKLSKMEVECGIFKSKCDQYDDKLLEAKRKEEMLDSVIRDKEEQIIKLNLYLKQAEDFADESRRELHYVRKEAADVKHELDQQSFLNANLKEEMECLKLREKALEAVVESKRLVVEDESKDREPVNLDLDLEGVGQSARSTVSSRSCPSEEINENKYKELKESRNRLKQKTKILLRQYRNKRNLLDKKERQLANQKAGLLRLQTLHQTVESNHYIVLHHLGQQIEQVASLVMSLWPPQGSQEPPPALQWQGDQQGRDRLAEWITHIDNVSNWIISKLVKVSMDKRDKYKKRKDEKFKENRSIERPIKGAPIDDDTTTAVTSSDLAVKEPEQTEAFVNAFRHCQSGLEEEVNTVADLMKGLDKESEDTWM